MFIPARDFTFATNHLSDEEQMTSEVLTEKKTDEEEGKRENGLSVVMLLLFDMSTKKIFFLHP